MIDTPQQLSFASLLFPGRTVLYVGEVAEKLKVTDQHVIDLIEEGEIKAVNIGGAGRKFYRIPIESYEEFVKKRMT